MPTIIWPVSHNNQFVLRLVWRTTSLYHCKLWTLGKHIVNLHLWIALLKQGTNLKKKKKQFVKISDLWYIYWLFTSTYQANTPISLFQTCFSMLPQSARLNNLFCKCYFCDFGSCFVFLRKTKNKNKYKKYHCFGVFCLLFCHYSSVLQKWDS